MIQQSNPVGVFDSGLGGISVLREMAVLMPEEDFIYVGDSRNAPYGTKAVEEVRKLTIYHIKNLVEYQHVKAIALACNTATSAAVSILRDMYPDLPLVGVEPALKPAVLSKDASRVLVMATPRTLEEPKFRNLFLTYASRAEIIPLPCPGLMEYVEKGILKGPEIEAFLTDLLDPYRDKDLSGIVLGCTHYPFLKEVIRKLAGPSIQLFDGGEGTARELDRRLKQAGLRKQPGNQPGKITFYNSSDKEELLNRSLYLYSYNNPYSEKQELIVKKSRELFQGDLP